MRQSIGELFRAQRRWVVTVLPFDQTSSAGCAAGRCKMHINTSWFGNDGGQVVKIASNCEVELDDWSCESWRNLVINSKRVSKT